MKCTQKQKNKILEKHEPSLSYQVFFSRLFFRCFFLFVILLLFLRYMRLVRWWQMCASVFFSSWFGLVCFEYCFVHLPTHLLCMERKEHRQHI